MAHELEGVDLVVENREQTHLQKTVKSEALPVELYIAPWALPNEPVPVHVRWHKDFGFEKVKVVLPDGWSFVDFTNLDQVAIEGTTATVDKKNVSGSAESSTYFGFAIEHPQIPKDIRHEEVVAITFYESTKVIFSGKLTARLFRPQLSFVKAPESIVLTDASPATSLPLYLRYSGFGDIQLRVEARIGGRIVSEGGSLPLEILRRLWLFEKSGEKEDVKAAKRKAGMIISSDYVKEIVQEVQQIVESGQIPPGAFDKEALTEMREWLKDPGNKGRFMDLLYSRTQDMMLNLLVDLLDSHPARNVSLVDPRARIATEIRAPMEELLLRLRYRDLMMNEYEPVDVTIKIVDKRIKGKPTLNIPIVTDKWEDKPLLNVAGSK
jgi:hypothetical protein